ncbi:hypothetical protein BASA61_000883 [Batrachochytrium salamandrivorans]|nr:hypothetical protein BASA61_000883 [Batrachochytrium salamandrivorans]
MQKYLTQPDHGSPYVLQVFDYAVNRRRICTSHGYPGEGWMALDRYTTEKGKLSVVEVRLIAREVLKALLSLKAFGVVHGNVAEEIDLAGLGKLMYHLVTLEDANQHPETRQEVQEKLRKSMENPEISISNRFNGFNIYSTRPGAI